MTTVDPMFIVFGASKKKVQKFPEKNCVQLNSDRNLKMSEYLCLF